MSKFKVGDRVKAVGGPWVRCDSIGKCGTVYGPDNELGICVKFDDGSTDYGRYEEFELIGAEVLDTEGLKASLQNLHKQFLTAGDSIPAFALKEVISEHFGVTWQEPQEGRWVEKEGAA